MKVRIMFNVMVLLTVIGCTQKSAKLPEGTWEMVNFQYYSGDTLKANEIMNDSINQVKIWTPNYFTFVGRSKADSTYQDNYGGGTYKLDGINYEENIQFHSYKSYIGQTVKLLLELKGDTLVQTFPVDNMWKPEKSHFIEKYVRLQ